LASSKREDRPLGPTPSTSVEATAPWALGSSRGPVGFLVNRRRKAVSHENRCGPNFFLGDERGTCELPSHGGCEWIELT
jgi:hypothetical protein